jgi:integrase
MDEISHKQAMKLRAEILEVANDGRMIIQAQQRFRGLVTRFKEDRLPQLGAGTAAKYTSQIDCHVLPAFGDKKLCDIDRQMVEAWLTSKSKLSWWTREGLRGVMSSIFAAAKEWKLWTGDNPASGVRLGRKKEAREKRLLTAEQLQAILAAVSDDTRFMILIAVVAGLRISEVCGLQWRDIDFEAGTLTVQRRWYRGDLDEPKSEAARRTRQIGPLAVEFRLRKSSCPQKSDNSTGFIFQADGVPVDERDILRFELRPILKRLGLYYPGFGWHAFRRQNVTWRQTVGGANPFEAQKAAGHTRLDTTMLYSLRDADRERGQVEAIFNAVVHA